MQELMMYSWLFPLGITLLTGYFWVWREEALSMGGALGFVFFVAASFVAWAVWAGIFTTYMILR